MMVSFLTLHVFNVYNTTIYDFLNKKDVSIMTSCWLLMLSDILLVVVPTLPWRHVGVMTSWLCHDIILGPWHHVGALESCMSALCDRTIYIARISPIIFPSLSIKHQTLIVQQISIQQHQLNHSPICAEKKCKIWTSKSEQNLNLVLVVPINGLNSCPSESPVPC